jgi:hypothetical protein
MRVPNPIALLWAAWRRTQRRIDRQILWPAMVKGALGDLALARDCFRAHMQLDPAYSDLTHEQRDQYAAALGADGGEVAENGRD